MHEEELLPEQQISNEPTTGKRNRFSNAQHNNIGSSMGGLSVGRDIGVEPASDDEDNYSDDDFEVQVDSAVVQEKIKGNQKPNDKSLQIIQEFTNESHD